MKTSPRTSFRRAHRVPAVAAALASTVMLAACAGGIATSGTGGGEGVDPRSDFSAYEEALSDMDPVTLTYQPSASSAQSMDGYRSLEFKENVEEASGGKITVDLVYAQAIAGYGELTDALVDGRVDIAYILPLYDPTRFPVTSAFVAGTTLTGASPRAGELAANAAMLDAAWNSPELLDEFEANGLTPLLPFNADGATFAMCSQPGAAKSDWNGRQVRISSTAQQTQLPAMGSSPVSMEYLETFEALQRNAIDCTLSAALPAITQGFMEVAPHYSYSDTTAFARGAGAIAAGSSFDQLPLAAQQLIFDQMVEVFANSRRSNLNSNVEAAIVVRENGGTFAHVDEETDEALAAASSSLIDDYVQDGTVPEGFEAQIADAVEKWTGVVDDMGFADEGGFDDVDSWHDDESADFMPLAEKLYEDVMTGHRPE